MPEIVSLKPSAIDCTLVGRAVLNDAHVADLAADLLIQGVEFPPVQVIRCGTHLYLVDGLHRLEAIKKAGKRSVRCLLKDGDSTLARLEAARANQGHGLRRSDADKRRAVLLCLEAEPEWTDDAVAKHCGVSSRLVRQLRQRESEAREELEPVTTAVEAHFPAREPKDIDREILILELARLFARADKRSRLLGKTTEETLALHRAGTLHELAWLPLENKND